MSDIGTTQFELVTPTEVVLSQDADMVVAPGELGLFGVLVRHMPMISTLKRGVVEIHEKGEVKTRIMVDGGIADVNESHCIILTERAEMLKGDNKSNMESRLKEAESSGHEEVAEFLKSALAQL